MRILLVEDSESLCEALTAVLEREKFEVQCVHNGEDGLEYGLTGIYDLILLDVMMPKKNGYEATRAIRELKNRPDAKSIPIVAMTANAFVEDVQASLDAGMNGHLAKPIVMEEVKKTIIMNLNR